MQRKRIALPAKRPPSADRPPKQTRWTRETILAALKGHETETGDRLRADDINHRDKRPELPSLATVVRHFGSWNEAAGIAYGSVYTWSDRPPRLRPPTKKTPALKLKVLSSTKPTRQELRDREVAYRTEEPA
jgi:hypothetical protein